jgi:hypothetical protein
MKIEITYYDNKITIESSTDDDFVTTDEAIDMTMSLLKGLGYQKESIIKSLFVLAHRELGEIGASVEELFQSTSSDEIEDDHDEDDDEREEVPWTYDKHMDGYEIHSLKLSDNESYEIHSNSRLGTAFNAYHIKDGHVQFLGLHEGLDDALEEVNAYNKSLEEAKILIQKQIDAL